MIDAYKRTSLRSEPFGSEYVVIGQKLFGHPCILISTLRWNP